MSAARFRCATLVGRDEELARLAGAAGEALRGTGGMALVGGDAGIGKTRLIEALFAQIRPDAAFRVSVGCFDAARAPLAPVLDALRALDADPRFAEAAAPVIRWLLDPPTATSSPLTSRRDHFFAIASYVRTCADIVPLLISIEDVHWADAETLEFVRFLASRTADMRAFFVLTYRPAEFGSTAFSAWYTAIARLPAVSALTLDALGTDDMIRFIDEATRDNPAMPARTRREIRLRAEGNPLFAEELLEHAAAGPAGDALPGSLRVILLERLQGFDEARRAVFECAAAFVSPFTARDVAIAAGRRIAVVETALRTGRDHGLVAEVHDETGAWAFRHNLIRESIYATLPRSAAARIHLRIAQLLEAVPAERCDLLSVAHHWSRAGDPVKAARYCEAAGDRAMLLCASADAVDLYERALRASPEAAAARTRLLTKLGTALVFAGAPKRAAGAFEEALRLAAEADDAAAIADVALRLARCHTNDRSVGDAIVCLRDALETIGDAAPERPALLASLAWTHAVVGQAAAADATLALFAAAQAPASVEARIEALDARGTSLAHQWLPEPALEAYERAAELALTIVERDRRWAMRAFSNFAEVAAGLGAIDRALEAADAAVRNVRDWVIPAGVPFTLAIASRVHLRGGRIGLANALFREADVLAIEAESPRLSGHLAMCAFALAARFGDGTVHPRYDPETLLADAIASEEAAWLGGVAGAIVEWHAAGGRIAAAHAVMSRAFAALVSAALSYELVLQTLLHGHADHRTAALRLLRAVPADGSGFNRAMVNIRSGYAPGVTAAAKRAALESAAREFARAGMPHEEGVAFELAGEKAGALNAYRRAGSSATAARLANAPGVAKRAPAGDALTPREAEVAALVGSGASNRLIAERIGLSERTVEAHLRAIFAKLDVRSRYELMAKVLEGQAVADVVPR